MNKEYWPKKKILVTGAGGFIGSHITETLVKKGAEVTAFVRYNSRGDYGSLEFLEPPILDQVNIIAGDLKDPDAISEAVKGNDIVIHLAALIGIPYSYVHPIDYVQTNVLGTSYLLNSARKYNIEKFIHFSTSEVYGTAQYVPIDESHPLQGQSPYSASKIAAEQLAMSFYYAFDLPVTVVRPFNTYGPRQPSRAIIPTIISQALVRDSISLGSLKPTRDLNYVSDTVDGILRMVESPNSTGETINLGSSKEISVGDLARKIFALLGKSPNIQCEDERKRPAKSEVERLLADNTKAKELLGWEPRITLNQGLLQTIEWVKNNPAFFQTDRYHV